MKHNVKERMFKIKLYLLRKSLRICETINVYNQSANVNLQYLTYSK